MFFSSSTQHSMKFNMLINVKMPFHIISIINEPPCEISNNVVCATTSKASDQPAHTRSLVRAFASGFNIL